METHAMKLLTRRFYFDVNARGGFEELLSHHSIDDFNGPCATMWTW